MNPLSEDLRKRIIAARQKGQRTVDIARRFHVGRRSVERFWKSFTETGHCQPKQHGGYRRSRLEGHDGSLRQWIRQQPDLTLDELQQRCQSQLQVHLSRSALANRLVKLGLSFKKNPARRRARAGRH